MNHASLFSGIGAPELAAEWMGWENVFHCEWNEFGQKVLNYYWPKSISYGDITKTDFTIHRGNIDILTGGFPCQPYSAAGKRLGTEDERHLWPEMLRAIREIQPTWVIGENVSGLVNWSKGLVFDEVQADLETEGYEVIPFLLPACGVNAPHKRERVWFVAYSESARAWQHIGGVRSKRDGCSERIKDELSTPYSHNARISTSNSRINGNKSEEIINRNEPQPESYRPCYNRITPDTGNKRLQGNKLDGTFNERKGREQAHRPITELHKISDWLKFPIAEPTIRRGNDGFSPELVGITVPKHRNESIKSFGNSMVPQVIYQIFKAIEQF
jgi:DNA (cytosine-5)-methyltransferase 1